MDINTEQATKPGGFNQHSKQIGSYKVHYLLKELIQFCNITIINYLKVLEG